MIIFKKKTNLKSMTLDIIYSVVTSAHPLYHMKGNKGL